LTIPGQNQNLPQFLETIIKESNKKFEELTGTIQNTKITDTFYQLPSPKK
jgi:hypothetical protein